MKRVLFFLILFIFSCSPTFTVYRIQSVEMVKIGSGKFKKNNYPGVLKENNGKCAVINGEIRCNGYVAYFEGKNPVFISDSDFENLFQKKAKFTSNE